MSKLIVKTRFAQTPNVLLEDKTISFRAKGVYAYIQSKPDGWDFSIEKIAKSSGETQFKVKYALQELSKAGYLYRETISRGRGSFEIEYHLFAEPNLSLVGVSTDDNTTDDISTDDTPTDINKNVSSNKVLNKERKEKEPSPSNFNNFDKDGIEEETFQPSLPPLPPKSGSLSKMKLGVKKVLSRMDDFDELVNKRDLSILEIMDQFSEYWIIGQGREFNPQNYKGLHSSFRQWILFGGNDTLSEVESTKGLSNTSKLNLLVNNISGKQLPNPSQKIALNGILDQFEEKSILEIAKSYNGNAFDGYETLMTLIMSQRRIDRMEKNRQE
jgi:hypothetical protein